MRRPYEGATTGTRLRARGPTTGMCCPNGRHPDMGIGRRPGVGIGRRMRRPYVAGIRRPYGALRAARGWRSGFSRSSDHLAGLSMMYCRMRLRSASSRMTWS